MEKKFKMGWVRREKVLGRAGLNPVYLSLLLMLLGIRAGVAETPSQGLAPELASRFKELEVQILGLQKQIAEQSERHEVEIEKLREKIEIKVPQEKPVYGVPSSEAMPKWLEGLRMGGDFRLRYEAFEQNEATRERNRFRYRLRWKIEKAIAPDLDLGFRLVSGAATDPTSTNQTFTGDFGFKTLLVDQAYVKYRPSFLSEWVPSLSKVELGGGKLENPFFEASSGLVWDSDLMPEGFYESLEASFLHGKLRPFVTTGQFILQENALAPDAELYGVQSGLRWVPPGFAPDSGFRVTNAVAYYDFSDYAINSNFLIDGVSLARGNTRSGNLLLAGDFDIFQVYNEIGFKVGSFPVKLFSDWALNAADRATDPLGRNVGYEYGVKIGSAKKRGDWEAVYYYAYIEPNAVVGAFSESDFGAGHADKRGSAVLLKYKLTDSLKLGLAGYFVNNVTGADDETRRFQTDLEWVF